MVDKKVVMAVKRSSLGCDDGGVTFPVPFRRGVSRVQLPATGLSDRGRGVRGRHDRNPGRHQAGCSRRQAASADPRQGGASIIGPTNPAREAQNVDRLAPPPTDHGTMPNLRFSFADVYNRLQPGGWARQVTVREMPVATQLACVNMRLTAGAVREMHWHKETEWGYVLKGRMRITAVDGEGRAFQDDISEGNIWNFPSGIPHSLQGLEGDGCEFLLVFDNGNFNEDETFLVTDWLAHVPKEVLAKNFGVPESAFANIPKSELYIFESQVPGPLAADRVVGAGPVAVSYSHRLMDQEPIQTKGGRVRIVDSSNFPATTTISAALVEVEPGGMRELHWHPNSDELQYHIAGQSRMTVYASGLPRPHSITSRAMSPTCRRTCPTISRTQARRRCGTSSCGRPTSSPTSRWRSGWRSRRMSL